MQSLSRPMRIAMLDVAAAHKNRLAALLHLDHVFVDTSGGAQAQAVDVVIALRFGAAQAKLLQPRLLHLPGAGDDAVDKPCLPPGCVVCNVFEHETPLAEYVLASMLEHAIGYGRLRRQFDPARWQETYAARSTHAELHGKTLGLIGYGHIGRAVAERARPFGMKVHAISNSGKAPGSDWCAVAAQLDELLAAADYLVIACPLTAATRELIGAPQLAVMKKSAVLINISRAQIVAEEPLYEALRQGRLRGATLDVWYAYPSTDNPRTQPSQYPFWELPNVHCTAHTSALTEELYERRYTVIADNLERLWHGNPLRNVIFTAPQAAGASAQLTS
jgi:phosphoglycerate dehydrogenase-like enzyme